MDFLRFLEGISTPVATAIFSFLTYFGDELFFMVLAITVFWCVSKRDGYYILAVGFLGTVLNQFLKLWFRVPRPWVLDPDFTIVESARAEAGGYSFPSGHPQCVVGYMGGIARFTKRTWLRVVCIILALLTAVSRMYLGVHTPADVGVSLLVAAALVFLLYPLIESTLWFPNRMYAIIGGMLALALGFVAFMELYPFPADIDGANLASAVKNAYTMAGAVAGVLVVYAFDSRILQFPTRAPWWGQLIKLVGGLALVVLVRVLLKEPLLALCGGHEAAHAIRYFIMVLVAGGVWPMTFRFFERYAK